MPFDRNLMTWEEYTKTEEYKKKKVENSKRCYEENKHVHYHCSCCNVDMKQNSFYSHIKSKKHLKNYDEAKAKDSYYFSKGK